MSSKVPPTHLLQLCLEECPHWRCICVWIEESLCPINASGTACRQICVYLFLGFLDSRCISCLSSAKLSLWSPLAQYDAPMIFILTFFLEDVLMNSWSCTQVSRCLFRVSRQKGKVKSKRPNRFKSYFLVKTHFSRYAHSTTTTWQRPSLKMYLTKAPSLWVWLVYKHWQHSRQNLQSLDLGRWILKVFPWDGRPFLSSLETRFLVGEKFPSFQGWMLELHDCWNYRRQAFFVIFKFYVIWFFMRIKRLLLGIIRWINVVMWTFSFVRFTSTFLTSFTGMTWNTPTSWGAWEYAHAVKVPLIHQRLTLWAKLFVCFCYVALVVSK